MNNVFLPSIFMISLVQTYENYVVYNLYIHNLNVYMSIILCHSVSNCWNGSS